MLNRLSITSKLTLLAGVPVLGALVLASLLWMHAQRGAKSAAALGSVEDLAELSVSIAGLVQELQTERALSALVLGYRTRASDPLTAEEGAADRAQRPAADLVQQRAGTDAARTRLRRFLDGRALSGLPARLRRDLEASNKTLEALAEVRGKVEQGQLDLDKEIEFFAAANNQLIGATAALTQLSDDGDLLRGISALVSVMQVKERASQEHALLAGVLAIGSFPPGTYRSFVRLTTEEQAYIDVLRTTARDQDIQRYESSGETREAKRAVEMRRLALENIDEEINGDAAEWFGVQAHRVGALHDLETRLTMDVRLAAAAKLSTISRSRQTSLGLSGGVLVFSVLLAGLIARGVAGSVSALTKAAAQVQRDNDFSVRAVKTTDDELGRLTLAFNEMLSGIQQRDGELDDYRRSLESKVEQRTRELTQRNAAMRLVLDNVDQGLATIRLDGTLEEERSAAFDRWFGAPGASTRFGTHLARGRRDLEDLLEVAWDEVVEGFFPLELTIGQMPRHLAISGREFALSYKPIMDDQGRLLGALLIVSDVTADLAQRRRDAEQSERIAIFESFMKDREGFIEFVNEGDRLLEAALSGKLNSVELKRNVHTLKGICALYAVKSVATACHEVETALEGQEEIDPGALEAIRVNWARFVTRVDPLIGGEGRASVVIEDSELEQLLVAVRERRPYADLERDLARLRFEPLSARFFRLGEQAKRLARGLGKPEPLIVTTPNQVRLPREAWADFWSAFTHLVRNAVDHGLEDEATRASAGKAKVGSLKFTARSSKDVLELEVSDDGRGVDWERVAARAKERGMPSQTRSDLVAALFADSFSTVDAVSETSGRGIGMGAVRQAARGLGGNVDLTSIPGKGTTITFKFPVAPTRPGGRLH